MRRWPASDGRSGDPARRKGPPPRRCVRPMVQPGREDGRTRPGPGTSGPGTGGPCHATVTRRPRRDGGPKGGEAGMDAITPGVRAGGFVAFVAGDERRHAMRPFAARRACLATTRGVDEAGVAATIAGIDADTSASGRRSASRPGPEAARRRARAGPGAQGQAGRRDGRAALGRDARAAAGARDRVRRCGWRHERRRNGGQARWRRRGRGQTAGRGRRRRTGGGDGPGGGSCPTAGGADEPGRPDEPGDVASGQAKKPGWNRHSGPGGRILARSPFRAPPSPLGRLRRPLLRRR